MRQVSLLPIAVHPVLREDTAFGVVENPFAAQVIEEAGHPVAEVLGGHAQGEGLPLDPRQAGVQSFVLDLHPSPRFETDRLAGRQRHFAQDLDAKELASLLFVPTTAAFLADDLPNLGDECAREGFVAFEEVIQMEWARSPIETGPRLNPSAIRARRRNRRA